MSIKVDVFSPDLERQISLLQQSQRFLDKHFHLRMKNSVEMTYGIASPKVPHGETGKAAGALRRGVYGFGKSLIGTVGFYDGEVYYINIVEHGAKRHSLVGGSKNRSEAARRRLARQEQRGKLKAAHVFIGNRWVTMTIHPGFSKRGFMAASFSAARPRVEGEMKAGADDALAEMVVR